MEGDTLPNALAALARTRERTLAEIDENLAAKEAEAEAPGGDGQPATTVQAKSPQAATP
jgi:hypothetical protein